MRGHKHFVNTLTKEHQRVVIPQLRTAKPINGVVAVNYSNEGLAIFEVVADTPELFHLEFISTGS